MYALIDGGTAKIISHKDLGHYDKPVSFAGRETIRPALRKGVAVNSNAGVELCNCKPKLFNRIQEIGAPLPDFRSAEDLCYSGQMDFTKYDQSFGGKTAVLRSPGSAKIINHYADLTTAVREQGGNWAQSVFYEQINDYMYRVTFTATSLTNVEYKSQKRDHILEMDISSDHAIGMVNISELETITTEIVRELQIDFVQVTFEFGAGGYYLVDVTTSVTTQTVEALKAVIRRKVNMAAF